MQELLLKTKSLLIHSESKFKCHQALVPRYTLTVTSFPRTGAASKIDRGSLAELARGNLNQDSGQSILTNHNIVEVNEDGMIVFSAFFLSS